MAREVEIASWEEIPDDEAAGFRVDGLELVLCKVDGEVYAFQGMCTHEDLPLDGGEVFDGRLTCEWHGAEFDAKTGEACGLPATRPLRAYDTLVRDGRVFVVVET